jgi:hypothetical protein
MIMPTTGHRGDAEPTPGIVEYELAQLGKSVSNLKALGWM